MIEYIILLKKGIIYLRLVLIFHLINIIIIKSRKKERKEDSLSKQRLGGTSNYKNHVFKQAKMMVLNNTIISIDAKSKD